MRFSARIALHLEDLSFTHAFGIPGEDIVKIVAELPARGVEVVMARHENNAVAMADGFARVSGTPGLAFFTDGPGLTNALTAMKTAAMHGSKVLVLTGKGNVMANKGLDTNRLCEVLGVRSWAVHDDSTALHHLAEAYAHACEGNVAVVEVNAAALDLRSEDDRAIGSFLPEPRVTGQADPTDAMLVAEVLSDPVAVRRPIILAGAGARDDKTRDVLLRIAELTGALLTTTLKANGLFEGDPYSLGVCGTYSSSMATTLLTQADTVLAVGASLNPFTTYGDTLFRRARIIQVIDRLPVLTPEFATSRHVIEADAYEFASLVEDELRAREAAPGERFRTAANRRTIAQFNPLDTLPAARRGSESLDPRTFCALLNSVIPVDRILVFDAGRHPTYTIPHLRPQDHRGFVQTNDAASIGLALGGAIGASLARPGVLTVVGLGDAGFMMSASELDTAVRLGLPLLVVIVNDAAYGSEVRYLEMAGMDPSVVKVAVPSLEEVALAFGADATTVRDLDDAERLFALLQAGPLARPLVINLPLLGNVPSDSIDFLYRRRPDLVTQDSGGL